MTLLANNHGLTVVSDPVTTASHRIRFLAAEKVVEAEMLSLPYDEDLPEDLLTLNPTGLIPTVLDKDLVLYDERVISEYLDERFPHPSLMPIEPISRARIRLLTYRVESEWYTYIKELESGNLSAAKKKQAIQALKQNISILSPLFKGEEFLLSDSISLLDCAIVPVLWRLKHFGITLPEQAAKNIRAYAIKMFEREGFKNSLSEYEKEIGIM